MVLLTSYWLVSRDGGDLNIYMLTLVQSIETMGNLGKGGGKDGEMITPIEISHILSNSLIDLHHTLLWYRGINTTREWGEIDWEE